MLIFMRGNAIDQAPASLLMAATSTSPACHDAGIGSI